MKKLAVSLALILLAALAACEETSSPPRTEAFNFSSPGAFVLCEGLMGYDNSSLVFADRRNFRVEKGIFKRANGENLGDVANSMYLKGDKLAIVVTTNKKIEVLDAKTAKRLGVVRFKGLRAPRRMAFLNDTLAFVSDLLDHSVSLVDIKNFRIVVEGVKTGPAPEGLGVCAGRLFVANSGYGDYLADKPKAGTVSVFDLKTMKEIAVLKGLPNAVEIKIAAKSKKAFVRFNNLPKYEDSLGGIAEYDAETLERLAIWRDKAASMEISADESELFYLVPEGVKKIDLSSDNPTPELIVKNPNEKEIWYSLDISPDGDLWIGDAMNYQTEGKILIYKSSRPREFVGEFKVALNPNSVVFF